MWPWSSSSVEEGAVERPKLRVSAPGMGARAGLPPFWTLISSPFIAGSGLPSVLFSGFLSSSLYLRLPSLLSTLHLLPLLPLNLLLS